LVTVVHAPEAIRRSSDRDFDRSFTHHNRSGDGQRRAMTVDRKKIAPVPEPSRSMETGADGRKNDLPLPR